MFHGRDLLASSQPCDVDAVIIPLLQVVKVRLRAIGNLLRVTELATWSWSQESKPSLAAPGASAVGTHVTLILRSARIRLL